MCVHCSHTACLAGHLPTTMLSVSSPACLAPRAAARGAVPAGAGQPHPAPAARRRRAHPVRAARCWMRCAPRHAHCAQFLSSSEFHFVFQTAFCSLPRLQGAGAAAGGPAPAAGGDGGRPAARARGGGGAPDRGGAAGDDHHPPGGGGDWAAAMVVVLLEARADLHPW